MTVHQLDAHQLAFITPRPNPHAQVLERIAARPTMHSPRDLTACMLRLTPGARVDVDDVRTVQAAVAWWRGFGNALPFPAYLETIPIVPETIAKTPAAFPHLRLLTLVDPRLGHVASCRLAGVHFGYGAWGDDHLMPCDDRHALPTDVPYWIRANDGIANLGRMPSACLIACADDRLAGTVDVGIAIVVQHGVPGYVMDLPGSVVRSQRDHSAMLGRWPDGLRVNTCTSNRVGPGYGSVEFIVG